MKLENVLYEVDGDVGIIKFNRPHVLNAVNEGLARDLVTALEAARDDTSVRVVVLKGEGRAFCAGADLKEGARERPLGQYREHAARLQRVAHLVVGLGKPIIAAVQGYALGAGCEFAMICDIRIAAEDARFGFPETGVGATVTTGGTQILPRLVGAGRAKELFFTGDMVEAKEAERMGLVNKVVPLKDLDRATMEMARKIASKFPLSIKLTRACVDSAFESSLSAVLEAELEAACLSFLSGDRRVGMTDAMRKK